MNQFSLNTETDIANVLCFLKNENDMETYITHQIRGGCKLHPLIWMLHFRAPKWKRMKNLNKYFEETKMKLKKYYPREIVLYQTYVRLGLPTIGGKLNRLFLNKYKHLFKIYNSQCKRKTLKTHDYSDNVYSIANVNNDFDFALNTRRGKHYDDVYSISNVDNDLNFQKTMMKHQKEKVENKKRRKQHNEMKNLNKYLICSDSSVKMSPQKTIVGGNDNYHSVTEQTNTFKMFKSKNDNCPLKNRNNESVAKISLRTFSPNNDLSSPTAPVTVNNVRRAAACSQRHCEKLTNFPVARVDNASATVENLKSTEPTRRKDSVKKRSKKYVILKEKKQIPRCNLRRKNENLTTKGKLSSKSGDDYFRNITVRDDESREFENSRETPLKKLRPSSDDASPLRNNNSDKSSRLNCPRPENRIKIANNSPPIQNQNSKPTNNTAAVRCEMKETNSWAQSAKRPNSSNINKLSPAKSPLPIADVVIKSPMIFSRRRWKNFTYHHHSSSCTKDEDGNLNIITSNRSTTTSNDNRKLIRVPDSLNEKSPAGSLSLLVSDTVKSPILYSRRKCTSSYYSRPSVKGKSVVFKSEPITENIRPPNSATEGEIDNFEKKQFITRCTGDVKITSFDSVATDAVASPTILYPSCRRIMASIDSIQVRRNRRCIAGEKNEFIEEPYRLKGILHAKTELSDSERCADDKLSTRHEGTTAKETITRSDDNSLLLLSSPVIYSQRRRRKKPTFDAASKKTRVTAEPIEEVFAGFDTTAEMFASLATPNANNAKRENRALFELTFVESNTNSDLIKTDSDSNEERMIRQLSVMSDSRSLCGDEDQGTSAVKTSSLSKLPKSSTKKRKRSFGKTDKDIITTTIPDNLDFREELVGEKSLAEPDNINRTEDDINEPELVKKSSDRRSPILNIANGSCFVSRDIEVEKLIEIQGGGPMMESTKVTLRRNNNNEPVNTKSTIVVEINNALTDELENTTLPSSSNTISSRTPIIPSRRFKKKLSSFSETTAENIREPIECIKKVRMSDKFNENSGSTGTVTNLLWSITEQPANVALKESLSESLSEPNELINNKNNVDVVVDNNKAAPDRDGEKTMTKISRVSCKPFILDEPRNFVDSQFNFSVSRQTDNTKSELTEQRMNYKSIIIMPKIELNYSIINRIRSKNSFTFKSADFSKFTDYHIIGKLPTNSSSLLSALASGGSSHLHRPIAEIFASNFSHCQDYYNASEIRRNSELITEPSDEECRFGSSNVDIISKTTFDKNLNRKRENLITTKYSVPPLEGLFCDKSKNDRLSFEQFSGDEYGVLKSRSAKTFEIPKIEVIRELVLVVPQLISTSEIVVMSKLFETTPPERLLFDSVLDNVISRIHSNISSPLSIQRVTGAASFGVVTEIRVSTLIEFDYVDEKFDSVICSRTIGFSSFRFRTNYVYEILADFSVSRFADYVNDDTSSRRRLEDNYRRGNSEFIRTAVTSFIRLIQFVASICITYIIINNVSATSLTILEWEKNDRCCLPVSNNRAIVGISNSAQSSFPPISFVSSVSLITGRNSIEIFLSATKNGAENNRYVRVSGDNLFIEQFENILPGLSSQRLSNLSITALSNLSITALSTTEQSVDIITGNNRRFWKQFEIAALDALDDQQENYGFYSDALYFVVDERNALSDRKTNRIIDSRSVEILTNSSTDFGSQCNSFDATTFKDICQCSFDVYSDNCGSVVQSNNIDEIRENTDKNNSASSNSSITELFEVLQNAIEETKECKEIIVTDCFEELTNQFDKICITKEKEKEEQFDNIVYKNSPLGSNFSSDHRFGREEVTLDIIDDEDIYAMSVDFVDSRTDDGICDDAMSVDTCYSIENRADANDDGNDDIICDNINRLNNSSNNDDQMSIDLSSDDDMVTLSCDSLERSAKNIGKETDIDLEPFLIGQKPAGQIFPENKRSNDDNEFKIWRHFRQTEPLSSPDKQSCLFENDNTFPLDTDEWKQKKFQTSSPSVTARTCDQFPSPPKIETVNSQGEDLVSSNFFMDAINLKAEDFYAIGDTCVIDEFTNLTAQNTSVYESSSYTSIINDESETEDNASTGVRNLHKILQEFADV